MKLVAFSLVSLLSLSSAKEWWENGNFYQIYPRSYMDSDGDGVGDLRGIASKLQYIKDLGMDGAWLSPIFKSPMVDFGYDISDYYNIHYEFGTMKDFENLLDEANRVGLKIILDFVPNHTSDKHDWFLKSVQKEGKYTDYYIWEDGIPQQNASLRPLPPNNWISVFRYSAWEWNDVRKQYYLHQFAAAQPDLNYWNPDVVADMKAVIRFWLDKGVHGFRIDAVPFMFECKNADGIYPSEAVNNNCPDPDDYCHLIHTCTQDQPQTFDMIYQWRQILDSYRGDQRVILTEAYTSLDNIIKFYGNSTTNGSHVPFNFELLSKTNINSTAKDFSTAIDDFRAKVPANQYANWVLGNHDNKRTASRLGKGRADLINILLQTLPGIAVTYNGEEICMTDVYIPWKDTVDPQACQTNPQVFDSVSRDPARTPFQWDATRNAGFTKGDKTWLPVSSEYKINNVKAQQNAIRSHLHLFRKLTLLRETPSMDSGSYDRHLVNDDVLVYKRELAGSDKYIVLLNFGKTDTPVNLSSIFSGIGTRLEVILSSVQSNYIDGDVVQSSSVMAYAEVGTVFLSL